MVCVKQCFDPESRFVVEDGAIQEAGLRIAINPYDAVALTQAAKVRKAGIADELVAVTVGDQIKDTTMRHALAIGADRGIVAHTTGALDEQRVVAVLADIARREEPDLIMCGHLSSDNSTSQAPSRLAEELGIPAITMASSMEVTPDAVEAVHEIEAGKVTSRAALPALVSAQVYMSQAHYVAMKSLMMAKKKQLDTVEYPETEASVRVLRYEMPPSRAPGRRLAAEPEECAGEMLRWIESEVGVSVKERAEGEAR